MGAGGGTGWSGLLIREVEGCRKPFVRNGDPSDPQAPFPYASPEKRVVRQHVSPTKTAIIWKWATTGVGEKLEPSPAAGGGEGGT